MLCLVTTNKWAPHQYGLSKDKTLYARASLFRQPHSYHVAIMGNIFHIEPKVHALLNINRLTWETIVRLIQ